MRIRYIGRKAAKVDNIANTGITWLGHGDVQEVADPVAAAKLLAYDTVWALDDPDADVALLAAVTKSTEPAEPMVPASVVRKFVEMLLAADRLSVSDLPIVCGQLGIDQADIAVPKIEPPAQAPAAPAEQPASPAAQADADRAGVPGAPAAEAPAAAPAPKAKREAKA